VLLSRRRAVIRCRLCVKNVNARIGFARLAVNPTRMIAIALVAVARAKSVQAVKATAREINKCQRFQPRLSAPSVLGSSTC
jgi:hypothetical protein